MLHQYNFCSFGTWEIKHVAVVASIDKTHEAAPRGVVSMDPRRTNLAGMSALVRSTGARIARSSAATVVVVTAS